MFQGHLDYFQKPLLEIGLTQNSETMALSYLTNVYLLYFVMCEDPTQMEIHWISIWSRTRSHITSQYTWRLLIRIHDFRSVLGRPLGTSLGLSQFHVHNSWCRGSWLMCEATLNGQGAKTNTLPKTNTCRRLPIVNTLLPWTIPIL